VFALRGAAMTDPRSALHGARLPEARDDARSPCRLRGQTIDLYAAEFPPSTSDAGRAASGGPKRRALPIRGKQVPPAPEPTLGRGIVMDRRWNPNNTAATGIFLGSRDARMWQCGNPAH